MTRWSGLVGNHIPAIWSHRSSQRGLVSSISSTFQARRQSFSRFSRVMADSASSCISNQTSSVGEAVFEDVILVLPDTPTKVGCHADIDRAVLGIRHHVDEE